MLFLQPTNKTASFFILPLLRGRRHAHGDCSEAEPSFLFLLLSGGIFHSLPPGFLLGFPDDIVIGEVVVNHVVDGVPVKSAADIAVIDIDVGVDLPGVVAMLVGVCPECLVDGAELHASVAAPFHSLVKKPSFPDGPKHEFVAVVDEFAEGLCGMGDLLPYFRVSVLYNSPVKID